jgi:topoisomerase IV subunit B
MNANRKPKPGPDLFAVAKAKPKTPGNGNGEYTAKDIEVLEGLEPVRRRPGMYIGGTDERALHHLAAEVLDNAMDEAVEGHADRIEMNLAAGNRLTIADNGRGIPVDPHPKYPKKSALEVILTMLHSGGKFSDRLYKTSGGLHGVGVSVVNALAENLHVEVARDRELWTQSYARGVPAGKLKHKGGVNNRRGTTVSFNPDPQIFGTNVGFKPARLYRMARSKAYLYPGVEIRWSCDRSLIADETPAEAVLHFPGGLEDYLAANLDGRLTVTPQPFAGKFEVEDKTDPSRVEWAVAWVPDGEPSLSSYCNTVPTPEGGTHEAGLRGALTKSLRGYGELKNNKRAAQITPEDILGSAVAMLSVFIHQPSFSGQTKERLANSEATRLVENAVKDRFDLWLGSDPARADQLLGWVLERAEERLRRKQEKEFDRKSATRRLRLPGKLADCSQVDRRGTEIFLVEGDSAGGSAKQARNRETQAILPLRGKILNVASAGVQKLMANQELADLVQALGCGTRERYRESDLRYERVIIMTDADVDGAHIASLLMTFFQREIPALIDGGHLYLAVPPLYRLTQGAKSVYARDDAHKDALLKSEFKSGAKVEVSRFKGLGEMPAAQLKETTMDPKKRMLLQVEVLPAQKAETEDLIEQLMGRKPELRFQYIQANAQFVKDLDI